LKKEDVWGRFTIGTHDKSNKKNTETLSIPFMKKGEKREGEAMTNAPMG